MSTEEKVEMEAVPLKTDTDESTPAQTAAPDAAPEKKQAPKKTWFFQKDKKKTTTEAEEMTADEDVEKKKKKKGFWTKCHQKKPEGDEKPEMSIGIDMQMRDEKALNDHVKFQYEDVFGEPDTFHSFDCAWRVNYRVFEFTRTFFYKIFALIIFLPLSIIFGILFALFSAINVYFVLPFAKLASIPLKWICMAWSFLVANLFEPVTSAVGACFSRINVRKYGINNAPTDLIVA